MTATSPTTTGTVTTEAITVTGLYRYPIKSCRGMALDRATFDARGITHDREFLVIDPETGMFRTQRQIARMALIEPSLIDGGLSLAAPDTPDLAFERIIDGHQRPVVIWKDTVQAVDQGDPVADWLTGFLGVPSRLVRMAQDYVRQVDQTFATSSGDQVGFADGYPALLISEESLDGLNDKLADQGDAPLPMNRFRPNIVVRGAGVPHAEDLWKTVRIGEMTFAVVKPCARCQITTTDQQTAERSREPLRILASYRTSKSGVTFGQNLIHAGPGEIGVGDDVSCKP